MRSRIGYSIIFYILSVTLVIVARPTAIFDKDTDKMKRFGTGTGQTESVVSMGVVVVVLAIVCHFTFAMIDLVFG